MAFELRWHNVFVSNSVWSYFRSTRQLGDKAKYEFAHVIVLHYPSSYSHTALFLFRCTFEKRLKKDDRSLKPSRSLSFPPSGDGRTNRKSVFGGGQGGKLDPLPPLFAFSEVEKNRRRVAGAFFSSSLLFPGAQLTSNMQKSVKGGRTGGLFN